MILRSGVAAVDAGRLVRTALAQPDLDVLISRSPYVLAAGKAAWPMFTAVADAIPIGPALVATRLDGLQGTRTGVECVDAGHPAPTPGSVDAGSRALVLARDSASRGGLLVLLSGGASAMLAAPVAGVTLEEKVKTAAALMSAGAAIHELNCVRKHLSQIKGGQLAAAAQRTVTLALSDVHAPVPDDPSVIGSGPTVPDVTTFGDALEIVRSRQVRLPRNVMRHLERGLRGEVAETVKPGDPRIAASDFRVVGNRHTAVEGARRAASARGYRVVALEEATTGEARDAALGFVAAARSTAGAGCPVCVIGSGETTVTVRGDGHGGRNQEFALAAAAAVASLGETLDRGVCLASAGTDGIDGPTDAAGAIVDGATLPRARRLGLDAGAYLARNDAYRFFEPLGDLIRWGPTGTNVGDLHVVVIG